MKTSKIDGHTPDHSQSHNSTMDKVSTEFSHFLSDIEDLVKASTSVTGEELEQVRAKINDSISAAKASINHTSATVSGAAKKSAAVANTYAHEKPWQVIAASALVGIVFGALLARRS